VVPIILDCHLHARNVTHGAPNGTARIMNGRKALRMKSDFEKLQFKMCATICARIQIDEQDIGYIMKIAEHLLFYDVFINKKYIFYIFYLLFLSLFPYIDVFIYLMRPARFTRGTATSAPFARFLARFRFVSNKNRTEFTFTNWNPTSFLETVFALRGGVFAP
jgi:hypothetical protein